MSELKQSNAWLELTKHYGEMKDIHMRELFKNDENRFDKFSLEVNDILYDFSKNRIEFGGRVRIRIVKGLSFGVFGEVARVRDQISLAKEELTEAELLLRLQEIQTGYYIFGGVQLSYTFGSIYNNIVNPRFGRY